MSLQRAEALEAVRMGARTSRALAVALAISRRHASVLLYNLACEKAVAWNGVTIPNPRGWAWKVWEPV